MYSPGLMKKLKVFQNMKCSLKYGILFFKMPWRSGRTNMLGNVPSIYIWTVRKGLTSFHLPKNDPKIVLTC